MPPVDPQKDGSNPSTGRSSPREYLNNLWLVLRMTFIVVTVAGLWQMGPPMRVIAVVAGVAALGLLGAVITLIFLTVRREHAKRELA